MCDHEEKAQCSVQQTRMIKAIVAKMLPLVSQGEPVRKSTSGAVLFRYCIRKRGAFPFYSLSSLDEAYQHAEL
jgi:hypothetical protein